MESSTTDNQPAGLITNLNVKFVMSLDIRVDYVIIIIDRDKAKKTLPMYATLKRIV